MEIYKIILCGLRCTGKTTLYWNLQKTLNWPIFSVSEYLRGYLHRHNLKTLEEIESKNSEISDDLNERIDNLLMTGDHVIFDCRFYYRIRETFPNTIKILLTASEDVRLKRAAYREGTSVETQKVRLLKKEAKWVEKIKSQFPFEFYDPSYFDLVIDTSDRTPEEVLSKVLKNLQK